MKASRCERAWSSDVLLVIDIFYWYLINFIKYAFGWQGYLYKKGNEMETKRQVRKEGILSGFFDGKLNCTGGNFLTL